MQASDCEGFVGAHAHLVQVTRVFSVVWHTEKHCNGPKNLQKWIKTSFLAFSHFWGGCASGSATVITLLKHVTGLSAGTLFLFHTVRKFNRGLIPCFFDMSRHYHGMPGSSALQLLISLCKCLYPKLSLFNCKIIVWVRRVMAAAVFTQTNIFIISL